MRIPNIKRIKKPVKKLIFSFFFLSVLVFPSISFADINWYQVSIQQSIETGGRFEFRGVADNNNDGYASIAFKIEDQYDSLNEYWNCVNLDTSIDAVHYIEWESFVYYHSTDINALSYSAFTQPDCNPNDEVSTGVFIMNLDKVYDDRSEWSMMFFVAFMIFSLVVSFMIYLVKKFL